MTLTENSPQPDPSILEHAGDSISDSLIRTLPGNAYSSPEIFAKEQEKIFEQMWFCAARGSDLAEAGRLQDGAGRPGEPHPQPQPQGRAAGVLQRLPAPRRPGVQRGERQRQAVVPVPVPRLDLRPRRQAHRGPEPDQDARRRPGGVRPAQGARPRVARLHLGLRGRRAAVVRGHRDGRGPQPAR